MREKKRDETRVGNGQTDERKCTPGGRVTVNEKRGSKTLENTTRLTENGGERRETEVGECAESERDGELEKRERERERERESG